MENFGVVRESESLDNESFSELVVEAEKNYGAYEKDRIKDETEIYRLEAMDVFKEKKEQPNETPNFFQANLGADKDQYGMGSVQISRRNPFQRVYGDTEDNPFAYMLEDLEDDVDVLLDRLTDINRNLDMEIGKLNLQIGEMGPRSSTKFQTLANDLKRNTDRKVSMSLSTNRSNRSSRISVNSSEEDSPMAFDTTRNSHAFGQSQQEEETKTKEEEVLSSKNSELLENCEIFRQMTIETIKEEQNNVSEGTMKDKQTRTYAKLEDLKMNLLRLISDLEDTVTYNPFAGVNQSTLNKKSMDGAAAIYSSFVVDDDETMMNSLDSDDLPRNHTSKTKESEKKRLAKIVEKIIYQLEKLRFSLEKKVYPRDMTLRLFDCKEDQQDGAARRFSIVQSHTDRHLLMAFKLIYKLHKKIKQKMQTNKHSMLIRQLQSKVQLKSQIYQSFDTFLSEHDQEDMEAERGLKRAIIKARNDLRTLIKNKDYQKIDLTQEHNQHLLRLVMQKSDSKRPNNIEQMLQGAIFFNFKINTMNWAQLLMGDDKTEHYEVHMQLFYSNGKQLSNKTMIPLLKNKDETTRGPIQWTFLQIPMQALITQNLALLIEVYKVKYKYGDVEPARLLNITKSCSPVKTLEGFSTINLSATYALSNIMGGQVVSFTRLRLFNIDRKNPKLGKISDKYTELTPSDVKMNPNSAILTQILSVNGVFSFESKPSRAKKQPRTEKQINVDLHRIFERGIKTKNKYMKHRLMSTLSSSFNHIQVTLSSIRIPNPPLNSLIRIEAILINSQCSLQEQCFRTTLHCSNEHFMPTFESETKEITSSRVEFRDTKYLKLPNVEKVSDYKNYYLIFIIKIGSNESREQTTTGTVFKTRKVSAFDTWINSPESFSFKPTYMSVLPLYHDGDKQLLNDQKHQPKMFVYDHNQFLQMVERSHQYGKSSFKLQTWMFTVCQNERLSVETRLISNKFSTIQVINFILSMDRPQKLSLHMADKMLSKLRRLKAENPVELLIHHSQILDRIFFILSQQFDIYMQMTKDQEKSGNTLDQLQTLMADEDRQDVAFEVLLLMIDIFHDIFPDYKPLLTKYLEERFYQPKVFVALIAQLRLIGHVFKQDISSTNRFTLINTLSYLHTIIKITRISFIQHLAKLEKIQKDKIDAKIRGHPKAAVKNIINSTIKEEAGEHMETESATDHHHSAEFGGPTTTQNLQNDKNSKKQGRVENLLNQTAQPKQSQKLEDTQRTSHVLASTDQAANEEESASPLLNSAHSFRHLDESSKMSDSNIQPSFFKTAEDSEQKEAQRMLQQVSSKMDVDTFKQKKLARQTWRQSILGDQSNNISTLLKNIQRTGEFDEEDIQKNVSDMVLEVFKGCHQDDLKITMYLRGILLQNFHEILKEVSLVCGARSASSLLYYLYSPTSLRQQFKQTGQLDHGLPAYFKMLNQTFLDKQNIQDYTQAVDDSVDLSLVANDKTQVLDTNIESQFDSSQKIRLIPDFIGSGHFPFGADIDSSTTELDLNQIRVFVMGKILFDRTLEKIPGNSNQQIEETVTRFGSYVNLFGSVPTVDNSISNDNLTLRIFVFYFLHQLFFYVIKSESLNYDQDQVSSRSRKVSAAEDDIDTSLGRPSRALTNRYTPLIQNPSSFIFKVIEVQIVSMYQLSQDLLLFKSQEVRVQKLLAQHPKIEETMGPFMEQSSLILLTMISHASKRYLRNKFFERPSILAKMIDNLNSLDQQMTCQKPFSAYIDKQRLDIMAQFNQNISELIHDSFGKDLPELYVPVVNKLLFRYYNLWLNASSAEHSDSQDQIQKNKQRNMITSDQSEMIFNKDRLLENAHKLILKFKRKCLPDIIQFRSRVDMHSFTNPAAATNKGLNEEQNQVCIMRRAEQKTTLVKIFAKMYQFFEVSGYLNLKGVETTIQLLLEAALLEYEETNLVQDSAAVLFLMFTKIQYLELQYKEVQTLIKVLNVLLEKLALEHTNLKVNGQAFRIEFSKHVTLLEDSYRALYHFRNNKAKSNIFLKALYGCRVIELLSQGRLYYEVQRFSKKEYVPILMKDLGWKSEAAFLQLHSFKILQKLIDQGAIYLGNDKIKMKTLSDEMSQIVNSLFDCRCYATALEYNDQIKQLYQRNYDLEMIQKPLQMEGKIYQKMHKDQKQNYASYFKVEFLGNGHIKEFRNKTYILRSIANQDKLTVEEEINDIFDEEISFIEDEWPQEEDLTLGHKKYCHLVKVKPLTLKEIEEFDMNDLVDKGVIAMDDEDNQLLDKIQGMPSKLQNFYIQNFKNKFYYQESVRIPGVDAVAFDQKIQIFTVKKKFPYIIGLQAVISNEVKLVSCVRQAIKDIKDTDNALSIIKKTVREQAIDAGNVYALETTLRKTLVTEINGGFQRYLVNFFSDKSLSIKNREELLLKLYVTIIDHFSNVKESIELFSKHSTSDSATSMFLSKLSALERMLEQVEKKTSANRILAEREEKQEVQVVADAMRVSTNVLNRDSLQNGMMNSMTYNASYLVSNSHQSALDASLRSNTRISNDGEMEEKNILEKLASGRDLLDTANDSFISNDDGEPNLFISQNSRGGRSMTTADKTKSARY